MISDEHLSVLTEISEFFDNPDGAMEILQRHFCIKDGIARVGKFRLEWYVTMSREAFEKRKSSGATNRLEVLLYEFEPTAVPRNGLFEGNGGSSSIPATLDTYDRRIDPGMKQAWFNGNISRKIPRKS